MFANSKCKWPSLCGFGFSRLFHYSFRSKIPPLCKNNGDVTSFYWLLHYNIKVLQLSSKKSRSSTASVKDYTSTASYCNHILCTLLPLSWHALYAHFPSTSSPFYHPHIPGALARAAAEQQTLKTSPFCIYMCHYCNLRITEPLRLEKTSRTPNSNHNTSPQCPLTTPHLHSAWTCPGMGTLPPPWAACASASVL